MNPNAQDPKQNLQTKKPSTGSSKLGAVLSVLALILSAIGSGLIHADYRSKQPLTNTAEKVDDAVASGTLHVFSSLLGVPFLVIGIVLGLVAIVFVVLRLRKVKIGGLVFSVIWVVISVWALKVAIAAFNVIKASPSN
jgi:hypothetical protein